MSYSVTKKDSKNNIVIEIEMQILNSNNNKKNFDDTIMAENDELNNFRCK